MRALAGGLLAALIVAVGSGCGTGGPTEGGNSSNGKKLFLTVGKCGSCHELKDAGSRGQIGPNLSSTLAGMPDGYIRESIVAPSKVAAAGYGTGMMPEDYASRMTPAELDALVGFIVAGVRG